MSRIFTATRLRPVRPAWICSRLFPLLVAVATLLLQTPATAQTTSGTIATGNTLFNVTFNCHFCHTAASANRFNAIDAGGHIAYANARGMGGSGGTAQQYADIAAYIASSFTGLAAQSVTFETAKAIAIPNIALGTTYGHYAGLRQFLPPVRGSVSYSGTTATYTPAAFQCGADSFRYLAYRNFISPFVIDDGGTSNDRPVFLTISNPAAPSIVFSAATMSGIYNTVIANFNPVSTGGAPFSYAITFGSLPLGLGLNTSNGVISGTPTQVGTFVVNLTARNCFNGNLIGQSSTKTITITIAKSPQAITFAPLPPKLTSDAPINVFATGGGSVAAVTFSASGVCTSGGTNGATITLTGIVGTCSVSADQLGDTNYLAAPTVVQNFSVVAPGEVFPPNCQAPAGWAQDPLFPSQNWSVASDFASQGVCSFKSDPLPNLAGAQFALYAYTGNFQTGTISFSVKVSSFAGPACFLFAIDQVYQNIGSSCTLGVPGLSGILPFQTVNVAVTAGTRKIWILYYRQDNLSIAGSDAAWLDQFTMPLLTTITSSISPPSVTVGNPLSYQIVADNFPQTYATTALPLGLALNASTGVISGTTALAGVYPVTVTVANPGGVAPSATDNKVVTFTIDKIVQTITFAAINNRLTTAPAFVVAPTGGTSSNPVIVTASGVCTSSGTNGTTITFTGAVGTCSVTANQLGGVNFTDAVPVMQSFTVTTAASELFPPACGALPAGWSVPVGATSGWSTEANFSSTTGGCSLRSNVITNSQNAQIQFAGNFANGTIDFKYLVSSESGFDCLQFIIDITPQNIGGTCTFVSLVGNSGESGWVSVSLPITAGPHTLIWKYSKDGSASRGNDAAWIDDVVFPQYTLTVSKVGSTGTGLVFSEPSGIACGGSCSAALSGSVALTAFPNAGSYLASWSGGGCSGNGACIVNLAGNTTVTANFALIVPPGAPQNVSAAPENGQTTISFSPPAGNGGGAITLYTSTCAASGQTTRIDNAGASPIVATGLVNGVQYSCTVTATNSAGTGAATAATLVTPRTVPDAPTIGIAAPGNAQASIAFTPPGFNGGAAISTYTATCTSMTQPTRTNSTTSSPVVVTAMVNGSAYSCAVVANNAAGAGAVSASVGVTPRTLPGAPTNLAAAPRDGRAIFSFDAPVSDGGNAISSYVVSCNGGAITAMGAFAPITVNGLTNGIATNCTVAAINAAGTGPTAAFASITPAVQPGVTYWGNICSSCHGMTPSLPQLNAAGTTATVLNYVIANQPSMTGNPVIVGLTNAEKDAIAVYLASVIPPSAETTPFNTPKLIDLASQISVGTISFELLESMAPPLFGTLSSFTGTAITYTPNAGSVGMDTFTFRGRRDMPSQLLGDQRTVNITVQPPLPPVITSMLTASGTNGAAFTYQILATNSPTSYNAMNLPVGLSVDPLSGAISGTPLVGGAFMVTIIATNQGGSGMATLLLTLNPAGQTITFPAQSPTQPFSPGATFPISPPATASSTLPVSYVSKTTGVCTVSGTTATMLVAGICTIGANQGGNINFAAAVEVTRDVTITPTLPGAPSIGPASPGNNQAVVSFTAPANTGGINITGYTATCQATGQTTRTGTGSVSPVIVSGLINLVQYSCSVKATNSEGTGPASGNALVTPDQIPTPASIVSAASTSFTVNAPGSFSIVATGYPATFTYAVIGTLPMGVTLNTMTGVLSGTSTQAGTFMVTLTATNSGGTGMQMFTLTVNQASQTISFTNPGAQSISGATVPLTAVATSGLAISFMSDTQTICTVAGSNVTLVTTGTCTIRAQQGGNANFTAAPDVAQSFAIGQGSQSITFGAQVTSSRSFVAGATFGLSPVASASSGLAVAYSSLTTGVCTISGPTVTMVRAGICTIAANQSGNGNYSPAAQVTQSITITGSAPGAPTIGTATGGDTRITVTFSPPASDGGVNIGSYTANCSGVTQSGAASPIAVPGLTNGMSYSCSVTATNSVGIGLASASLMATPNVLPGATVWSGAGACGGCHGNPPVGTRLNVGGSTSVVLDYVVLHPTPAMTTMVTIVGTLSAQQKTDVAAYIRDFIPAVSATTPASTPVNIGVAGQVFLNTPAAALTSLQQVSAPANGTLSAFTGTTVTYTPNGGFTGSDTFTYRATQAGLNTDVRTVTVTVTPTAPVITSALTASGTISQAFNYQIAATNAPTSYDATGLPSGLGINMNTGAITGMPSTAGTTMVTISATGPGGTSNATLAISINLIPQTITFGAQSSPRTYVQNGVVMLSPVATGGASGNPIVYSTTTAGVCSVSGATFTMLNAGICTIAANQAGNATYAPAAQMTQSVAITGIAPAAPTIGAAQAGNTQATVNFSAPANTGGLPIASYTVNCDGVAVNGPGTPIVVSGLVNGVTYSCTVQATNLAGTSPVSGTVMVTPAAIMFTNAVYSRKLHGNGVGDKNLTVLDVPIAGALTVEPREIGSGHRIVFVFDNAVTSVTTLTVRDANNGGVGTATPSFVGNELVVTLTGVPDNKRVTVTATGVNGAVDVSRAIGFLVGDVNSSGTVNASDISAVKSRSGASVTMGNNFLFDLNASGTITNADVSLVKARSGLVLSP